MINEMIESLMKTSIADLEKARVNLRIYLMNPVGIGEHPDVMAEADKLLEKISTANGKIDILNAIITDINSKKADDSQPTKA